MTKISDDTFNTPELIDTLVRKAGRTDSFKKWKKLLEDGPHPTPEILFDYASRNLPDTKLDQWSEHIAHCLRCTKEVYSIRDKARRFGRFVEKAQTGKSEGASVTVNTQLEKKPYLWIESPITGKLLLSGRLS